jgi:hypothetical protein
MRVVQSAPQPLLSLAFTRALVMADRQTDRQRVIETGSVTDCHRSPPVYCTRSPGLMGNRSAHPPLCEVREREEKEERSRGERRGTGREESAGLRTGSRLSGDGRADGYPNSQMLMGWEY